eukprot:m.127772 g.127772  ORF g.127772 m.127772 type:complete len:282 (-) comp22257_c1_seq1:294-1139(-)
MTHSQVQNNKRLKVDLEQQDQGLHQCLGMNPSDQMPPTPLLGSSSHSPEMPQRESSRVPARQKRALVVVDVQNDFITGSLAVKDAETLVDPINALVRSGQFDVVVFSRDSHPKEHISFASTHPGQAAFTSIQLPNPVVSSTRNPGSSSPTVITQELWPDHCITGTPGWAFHPLLDTAAADIVVDKGQRKDLDSYSAFYKATDGDEESVLGKSLRDRGVAAVYSVGLAYDYCVGSTAIDAAREGFDSYLIDDLVKGVLPETCATMRTRLDAAGVVTLDHFGT